MLNIRTCVCDYVFTLFKFDMNDIDINQLIFDKNMKCQYNIHIYSQFIF